MRQLMPLMSLIPTSPLPAATCACMLPRSCLQYATNDGYTDGSIVNGPVQSFERLLRKLLAFPNSPAVVLMEFLATGAKKHKVPFWATGESPALIKAVSMLAAQGGLFSQQPACQIQHLNAALDAPCRISTPGTTPANPLQPRTSMVCWRSTTACPG